MEGGFKVEGIKIKVIGSGWADGDIGASLGWLLDSFGIPLLYQFEYSRSVTAGEKDMEMIALERRPSKFRK